MGRPLTRGNPDDPAILDEICNRLVEGEAIRSICADPAMPSQVTFYARMADDPAFRNRIARAREAQQHAEIEKTIELADEATVEDWQVKKLQIWARQWRAAKLAPKAYGDKLTLDATVTKRAEDMTDDELAAIAAGRGGVSDPAEGDQD